MIIGIAVLMVAGIAGAQTANVVRAGAFVLVDDQGRERAQLGMGSDGPALELYDAQGKVRIGLSLIDDEPGLALLDAQGKSRIRLLLTGAGPTLVLVDAQGKVIWRAHDSN